LSSKFTELFWGKRIGKDLLIFAMLAPFVYAVFSFGYRVLPDEFWGTWLAYIGFNTALLFSMLALWTLIRLQVGEKVSSKLWVQILMGVGVFICWTALIPMELKFHITYGTPISNPASCDNTNAIEDTQICRGRDFGIFGGSKSWYFGQGIPHKAFCAEFKKQPQATDYSQKVCQVDTLNGWTKSQCQSYGINDSYNCFECRVSTADTIHTTSVIAYDQGCSDIMFIFATNFESTMVLK